MAARVLIADDSGLIRKCIKRYLEQSGLQVDEFLEARNGQEALQILEVQEIDLLVTDISMPEMDGVELLRACQNLPTCTGLHKMVVSSIASEKWADELRELGVGAILTKPPELPDLIRALSSMKLVRS